MEYLVTALEARAPRANVASICPPPPASGSPTPTYRLDPSPQQLIAVEHAGPVEGHVRPPERPSPAGHQESVGREGHAGERRLDVPVHAVVVWCWAGGEEEGGAVVIRYVK